MRVLLDEQWQDGFLDYYRDPQDYVVDVAAWKNLEQIKDLYFVRQPSPWVVWNYVLDVGLRQTIRKILSRRQERYRNKKYVACGVGHVREAPVGSALSAGQTVVFLAPCHPRVVQRVVVPGHLLKSINPSELSFLQNGMIIVHTEPDELTESESWWFPIRGWSPQSGIDHSPSVCEQILDCAFESLRRNDWSKAVQLSLTHTTTEVITRVSPPCPRPEGKKTAVLFGYGHYAKNIIIPNVSKYLDIRAIHELDPLQVPVQRRRESGWDTAATLRTNDEYDVFLIAGFHHSHAPLAVQALKRDACAVVEKPIAVEKTQLTALVETMGSSRGKVFCCFHKRYSAFNKLALQDLTLEPGEPVSYHCIVYEVPLPPLHWYRWPNSRSRLITNGCHWIDHFLYLNEYNPVTVCDLKIAPDRTAVSCCIGLANNAFFTMVMTYNGSERIGPQDYIELRGKGRTARLINESKYVAESKQRIIRRKSINKMHSYEEMYRQISQRVSSGSDGDTVASVKGAAELGLYLEDELRKAVPL